VADSLRRFRPFADHENFGPYRLYLREPPIYRDDLQESLGMPFPSESPGLWRADPHSADADNKSLY
jgi:hypothetical protein